MYLRFHARRYGHLLEMVRKHRDRIQTAAGDRQLRILDVGPFFQTHLLREELAAPVDSVGFDAPFPMDRPAGELHVQVDLVQALADTPPRLGPYPLVVCAEVLEHLPVGPGRTFAALAGWVSKGGYLLLQTPNAAALPKRLKLLAGVNPFDLPAEQEGDFSRHVREYTLAEMRRLASQASLVCIDRHTGDDYGPGSLRPALSRLLPPSMRSAITLLLQRSD
jgi:hypothetical protein